MGVGSGSNWPYLAVISYYVLLVYCGQSVRVNGGMEQAAVSHILMIDYWMKLLQFTKYYNIRLHQTLKSWKPNQSQVALKKLHGAHVCCQVPFN